MKGLVAALLLVATTGVAAPAAAPAAPPARPNILFILADDLGWGDLGVFYQNSRRAGGHDASFATPNLDALAARGAMLTNHYCGAPVCAPSRASLVLGLSQGHANVRDNQFDKAIEDNHTLGTVLRRAGYTTAVIGKWGLHGQSEEKPGSANSNTPAHPFNRGFDYFYGYLRHIDGHEHYPKERPYFGRMWFQKNRGEPTLWENRTDVTAGLDRCYTADLFTARAKKYIIDQTRASPGKPFFLYLAFDTPHATTELPTQAYPRGGGLHGGLQWLGTPGDMINTASGRIDSWTDPEYAHATWDDDHDPRTPERPWPDVVRRYATSVRRIDACVADLMQLLSDLHIADSTLVVFTSDNGPSDESYLPEQLRPDFLSSFGPFDGIKRDCWEGGLRVPAIAVWPGRIPAGRIITEPSAQFDWLATLTDTAGLPAPASTDGISLLPALIGRGVARRREALYFEYRQSGDTPDYPVFEPQHRNRHRGQMQAVRLGDLMGVRYDVKTGAEPFEIYNVVTDPKEAHDLARDPAYTAVQRRMHAISLQSRRPDAEAPRPYDNELVPAVDAGAASTQGVNWRAYDGPFPWVPDFATLEPVATGTTAGFDVGVAPAGRVVGLCFTGHLNVPADGDYTFHLTTDTGAVLRLHEATVIDADHGYTGGTEKVATIRLQAGLHPFQLSSIHGNGERQLRLEWSGPTFPRQPITEAALRR